MGNHGQSQQILIILKATNLHDDPNLYHEPNPLLGNLKSQSIEKLRIHFKTIIGYWKQWEFHREKTLKSRKQFIGGWRSGREKAVGGNEGVREHDGPNDVFQNTVSRNEGWLKETEGRTAFQHDVQRHDELSMKIKDSVFNEKAWIDMFIFCDIEATGNL
jgi:hypothetical protein